MFKILLKEVESEKAELFDNIFFLNLKNGNYSRGKLKIFAEQYFLLSSGFINLLFQACLNISSEEIKMPIVKNIWDEFGNGDIAKSHRNLLKIFIKATGSATENIIALESTKKYINSISNLYSTWSEIEILSALSAGCESLTIEQYKIIIKPLINIYSFKSDDLVFFTEHIYHDPYHTAEIVSVLNQYLTDNENMSKAIMSANNAIKTEACFWTGLHNAMVE